MSAPKHMPRLIWFLLLGTVFFQTSVKGEAAANDSYTLDPELLKLERSLEERLQDKVKALLGEQARFAITVRFERGPVVPAPSKAIPDNAAGYFPLPLDWQNRGAASPNQSQTVRWATVTLASDVSTDQEAQGKISRFLSELFRPVPVHPHFLSIPFIPLPEPPPKEIPKPKYQPSLPEQKLLPWIPVVGAAILGILLGLGLWIMGRGIRSGFRTLAERVLSLAVNQKTQQEVATKSIPPSPLLEKKEPLDRYRQAFPRNLTVLKNLLHAEPGLVREALANRSTEMTSFLSLLPYLEDDELVATESLFSDLNVSESDLADNLDAPPVEAWLNQFIAGILVRKLTRVASLRHALPREVFERLARENALQVFSALKDTTDPAAFRVGLELLPGSELTRYILGENATALKRIFEASHVTKKAIAEAATKLTSGEAISKEQDIDLRSLFLQQVVMGPFVAALDELSPEKADVLMESVENTDEQFAAYALQHRWTARMLVNVPDNVLVEQLRTIPNETRAMLLAGFPAKTSERLTRLIKEPELKKMAADIARRLKKSVDPAELKKIAATCRAFLETLREKDHSGALGLKNAEPELSAARREAA